MIPCYAELLQEQNANGNLCGEGNSMIQVWHIKRHVLCNKLARAVIFPGDGTSKTEAALALWNIGGYVKVAEIDTGGLPEPVKQLDLAWRLTNNVENSWSMEPNSRVTVTAPLHVHQGKTIGRRSSMVGDVFVTIEDNFAEYCVVIGIGFEVFMTELADTKWPWMPEED